MKLLHRLDEYHDFRKPVALTIGNFDGVHKGHQKILQQLNSYAKKQHGSSVAITFRNHPSSILRPEQQVPLLCTLEHRLHLFENAGIDCLFLLTFTKEFSQQTAEEFLKNIRHSVPFSKLILGYDATIGKDRQGNQEKVQELSKILNFEVEYLPSYSIDGINISSSKIRELIQKGHLLEAEKFLGRRYSILSTVKTGIGKGKTIGFPTANIDVQGLCLPPLGVYAVKVILQNKPIEAIANLGIAPTVRTDNIPLLEVHLLNGEENLYGKSLEVIFYEYIRPEIRFTDVNQLKTQISEDIQKAKAVLRS